LAGVGPDWFAVRGAACDGRTREHGIDAAAVRGLAELIRNLSGNPGAQVDSAQLHARGDRRAEAGIDVA
jgi:hypothetical protein